MRKNSENENFPQKKMDLFVARPQFFSGFHRLTPSYAAKDTIF
jgi:hypothetical protein